MVVILHSSSRKEKTVIFKRPISCINLYDMSLWIMQVDSIGDSTFLSEAVPAADVCNENHKD